MNCVQVGSKFIHAVNGNMSRMQSWELKIRHILLQTSTADWCTRNLQIQTGRFSSQCHCEGKSTFILIAINISSIFKQYKKLVKIKVNYKICEGKKIPTNSCINFKICFRKVKVRTKMNPKTNSGTKLKIGEKAQDDTIPIHFNFWPENHS